MREYDTLYEENVDDSEEDGMVEWGSVDDSEEDGMVQWGSVDDFEEDGMVEWGRKFMLNMLSCLAQM